MRTTSRTIEVDRLPASWTEAIGDAFDVPEMAALEEFLTAEIAAGKLVYPAPSQFLAALERTPLDRVKVVILGQDPYHGPGQAHGLSFSVPRGVRIPPSLRNVLKEMAADIGTPLPSHGCLESWADQGVLLLNSSLSVEGGLAGSHAKRGWHRLTDLIIEAVNARVPRCAFVLWGEHAQRKAPILDQDRHLILASAHPSPLSAHRGFFGSRPFSKVNGWLAERRVPEVDWRLD